MRGARQVIRYQEDKMLQGARLLIVDDERAMRLSLVLPSCRSYSAIAVMMSCIMPSQIAGATTRTCEC